MPTRRASSPAASRKRYRARAFVVLGMHRSGTSAFAGILQHLGVDFGDKLLPGRPGENPRGFWEHAEVVRIHDDLLSRLGSSWDDPRLLPANWTGSSAARQATQDLLDVARADFGAHATWGLKDPRLCRLLPLWIPIFEKVRTEPVFIVAWRNPMDVAASLFERDGFALRKSLILWLAHVAEAEKGSRGYRRAFLSYDRVLADWPDAFASAASRLRLSWPEPATPGPTSRSSWSRRCATTGPPGTSGSAGGGRWTPSGASCSRRWRRGRRAGPPSPSREGLEVGTAAFRQPGRRGRPGVLQSTASTRAARSRRASARTMARLGTPSRATWPAGTTVPDPATAGGRRSSTSRSAPPRRRPMCSSADRGELAA